MRIRKDDEEKAEKYFMMVLFDISSAFGSKLLPSILQHLQQFGTFSDL